MCAGNGGRRGCRGSAAPPPTPPPTPMLLVLPPAVAAATAASGDIACRSSECTGASDRTALCDGGGDRTPARAPAEPASADAASGARRAPTAVATTDFPNVDMHRNCQTYEQRATCWLCRLSCARRQTSAAVRNDSTRWVAGGGRNVSRPTCRHSVQSSVSCSDSSSSGTVLDTSAAATAS